jgi:two-component system chemotaxis response regulator CheB
VISSGNPHGEAFPVVALVCSLGGADALLRVLGPLPPDLPAAVVALQHLYPQHTSTLTQRLAAATSLTVRVAVDGGILERGVVDVAPAGQHLLLAPDDRLLLVASGKQGPRPSADLLLVSMAAVLGERLTAVVLTGAGEDGAVGAQVVSRYGGRILVQDEATSQAYGMPSASLAAEALDAPVGLDELPAVITAIVTAQTTQTTHTIHGRRPTLDHRGQPLAPTTRPRTDERSE